MNSLDTIAVASRSFSKNQSLVRSLEAKYSKVIFNNTGKTLQDQELVHFLSSADKAIIGIEQMSAEVLKQLPKLKVISKYGVGINNLGVNKQSVAELALTLTLLSLRKIHRNHTEIVEGTWSQEKGAELFGKTVGLLGFGNIGQKFASLLQSFNCPIIFFDEKIFSNQELLTISKELGLKSDAIQQDKLGVVLSQADILSIHLPLLPDTENMISSEELNLLKPSVSIINTARGGIVDETALHAFLSNNTDSFASFDVFSDEPAVDNPLFELPNFFGTSHRSSLTHEGIIAMGLAAIAGLDDNKILT